MKVNVQMLEAEMLDFAAAMALNMRVGLLSQEGKIVPFYLDNVGIGEEEFSLPQFHCNGALTSKILNEQGYRVGPQSITRLLDDGFDENEPHPCAWECSTPSGLSAYGPTVEIAVARCLVLDKLGEEVEIPDELFSR